MSLQDWLDFRDDLPECEPDSDYIPDQGDWDAYELDMQQQEANSVYSTEELADMAQRTEPETIPF